MKATRKVAIAAGDSQYFTGVPCKHGHVAPRYVKGSACATCRALRSVANYAATRERVLANTKARYEANRARKLAKNAQWLAANKPRRREIFKRWQQKNSHIFAAMTAKRRRAVQRQTPRWWSEFDELVFHEAYELSKLREQATGIIWNVDHLVPLMAKTASGLHCAMNFQVIPEVLNKQKHNKMWLTEPCDWLKHI